VLAEHDRLKALQAALAALFADAVHLHGLSDARVMRYAGVRYGHHLSALEDERELYVAEYDRNLKLRFVQRERDLEVLWQVQRKRPSARGAFRLIMRQWPGKW
jgi:imidazolonepropionase-like amidohydrolase